MGQPQFSQIVAAAARESVAYSNLDQTPSLAASASETIDIYAPSGTICILKSINIGIPKPVGGTTGTHTITISSTLAGIDYLYGASNFGSDIIFDYGEWRVADLTKVPVNNCLNAIQGIVFDSSSGFRFGYTNGTNVAQNNKRSYSLAYVKRVIG